MSVERDPILIAAAVARNFLHGREARRLPWRWDGAIAALGLARLARADSVEGDRWLEACRTYLDPRRRSLRIEMADHCVPALVAAELQGVIQAGSHLVEATTAYLRSSPRNRLGALNHLGHRSWVACLYPHSIWIDSLMMYVLPAARLATLIGDRALAEFAFEQPQIFSAVLQDLPRGLFRHAELVDRSRRRWTSPWLRGNGWAAAALVDVLELMPRVHPARVTTIASFERLMNGVVERQTSLGTWCTVLDDPYTYEESAGSALVAYALAKGARLGLLGPDARAHAHRAFRALTARVRPRPSGLSLSGISFPTIPGPRWMYASIPTTHDLGFGVGAFLMLATELAASHSAERDEGSEHRRQ